MSLKYEPSSEPLHISAEQLFLSWELYRRLVQANTERANPNLGVKEKGVLDTLRRQLVQDLQALP